MSLDYPRHPGSSDPYVAPPRSKTARIVLSSVLLALGLVDALIAGWWLAIASAITGPECQAADTNADAASFFRWAAAVWFLPLAAAAVLLIRTRSQSGIAFPIVGMVLAVLLLAVAVPLGFISLFTGDAC